jgi:hypothetical protein
MEFTLADAHVVFGLLAIAHGEGMGVEREDELVDKILAEYGKDLLEYSWFFTSYFKKHNLIKDE